MYTYQLLTILLPRPSILYPKWFLDSLVACLHISRFSSSCSPSPTLLMSSSTCSFHRFFGLRRCLLSPLWVTGPQLFSSLLSIRPSHLSLQLFPSGTMSGPLNNCINSQLCFILNWFSLGNTFFLKPCCVLKSN